MTLTVTRSAGRALALNLGVLAVVGGALTGCSPTGGQSEDAAQDQLAAIEGTVEPSVDSSTFGIASDTAVIVSVRIADGYRVTDPESLTTFLVDMAWSVNEHRPSTSLGVAIEVPQGQVLDGLQAAQDSGLAEAYGTPELFQIPMSATTADGKKARARMGSWPGAVPVLPDGVIVPVG